MLNCSIIKKGKEDSKIVGVYVHGSGCTKEFLRPVAELVNCNSVLIDLPGHGDSEGELSFENYVSEIINFLKNYEFLKDKKIVLVGHSLGGCLVLKTACEFNVAGVVPISGMAQNEAQMACLDENGQLNMELLFSYTDVITDGTPVGLDKNPLTMVTDINMGNHMDFLDELKNIHA